MNEVIVVIGGEAIGQAIVPAIFNIRFLPR